MQRRIWIAGHNGMVGSAIRRALEARSEQVLTVSRSELDLRDQYAVTKWVRQNSPEIVIFAAAKVGGIYANDSLPADFIYDNLILEANVIHGSHLAGVKRLVFLGSSCIYPKLCPQPIKEEYLLTGPLEPTNEWYAIAKIAGIKLCQAYRKQYGHSYISILPCNLYGPHDRFDLMASHVIPALIMKVHQAKIAKDDKVVVWGTGSPLREFLYVDDLADAVVYCMDNYDSAEPINCGAGFDVSIRSLAMTIADVVGFSGDLVFDTSKPDGTPRKLMDSTKLRNLGWEPKVSFELGLKRAYDWYVQNHAAIEARQTAQV